MKILQGRLAHNLRFVVQPRRKPGLLWHVARSALGHRFGRNPLRNVDIALDYTCNLECVHCSCANLRDPGRGKLDIEDYARLAREMVALGAIYVSFTGGEPMTPRADLEKVMEQFPVRKMLIGLQTNAMLLNEERARRYRKLGVDVLQVSLDGFDPELHDAFRRREGAHAKVLENVTIARSAGLRVILCTSVTRESVYGDDLVKLLDYAEVNDLPTVVSIPCPSGNWRGADDMLLGDRERVRLDELLARFKGFRRDFHSNYSKLGCSASTEKLYVTPFGDVIPCPFIHVSFGNVKDEPLEVIRRRMMSYDRFTEYAPHCLAGEDGAFIDEVMTPTFEAEHLPVQLEDHPQLSGLLDEVPRSPRR